MRTRLSGGVGGVRWGLLTGPYPDSGLLLQNVSNFAGGDEPVTTDSSTGAGGVAGTTVPNRVYLTLMLFVALSSCVRASKAPSVDPLADDANLAVAWLAHPICPGSSDAGNGLVAGRPFQFDCSSRTFFALDGDSGFVDLTKALSSRTRAALDFECNCACRRNGVAYVFDYGPCRNTCTDGWFQVTGSDGGACSLLEEKGFTSPGDFAPFGPPWDHGERGVPSSHPNRPEMDPPRH